MLESGLGGLERSEKVICCHFREKKLIKRKHRDMIHQMNLLKGMLRRYLEMPQQMGQQKDQQKK